MKRAFPARRSSPPARTMPSLEAGSASPRTGRRASISKQPFPGPANGRGVLASVGRPAGPVDLARIRVDGPGRAVAAYAGPFWPFLGDGNQYPGGRYVQCTAVR